MAEIEYIEVNGQQDTPLELVGRLTATGGTGSASPVAKEGNLLVRDDITSITITAWGADDVQNGTDYTPSKTDVIYQTLQTSGVWKNCPGGGNLKFTCPATFFPDVEDVVVEVKTVLADSGVIRGKPYLVHVQKVRGA